MTNYGRNQYGWHNPNSGFPANGDRNAWGGYSWPGGVPTGFLGTTDYASSFGQHNRVVMRRELVPLWNLAFEICDKKHHYCVWSVKEGEVWGPWGYENRAVSGTNYASGHSMGLSVDINAPYNPYSTNFQSDMPPAMVADLESLGLYWGGRYEGQKYDAMHYGFCRAPGTIPQYLNQAKEILGIVPHPKPPVPKPPIVVIPEGVEVPMNVVRETGKPHTYAVAPGHFIHIASAKELKAGQKAGFFTKVTVLTHDELNTVRTSALKPNVPVK